MSTPERPPYGGGPARSGPEERLRDALAATAALVDPGAIQARRGPRPARGGRAGRWMPLAVAATVVAVVMAGVFLRPQRHAPAAPPAARFFIANVLGGDHLNEATVRDVATGAITATVKPPDHEWIGLYGAPDPHTFYLASDKTLYRLAIDDRGRRRSLTRVVRVTGPFVSPSPISGGPGSVAIPPATPNSAIVHGLGYFRSAISPDGRRIAFPTSYGMTKPVIDIADLTGRRVTVCGGIAARGVVTGLSWAADGHRLTYELAGSGDGLDGIWIADTRHCGDGTSLHQVRAWPRVSEPDFTSPVLSADGKDVYVIAAGDAGGHKYTQILDLDAQTGAQRRVLFRQRYTSSADAGNALWMFTLLTRDRSGRSLLSVDSRGHSYVIDIASGRVTTVPFPRGAPNAIAW